MKNLMIMAALVCSVSLFAAARDSVFQVNVTKVQLSQESDAAVKTKTTGPKGSKLSLVNKWWLVVRVTFVPGMGKKEDIRSSKAHALKAAGHGTWADGVKMRVRILYPADMKTGKDASYGVFSGITHFWTIPVDGKKHTAMMAVPPMLLERYLPLRAGSKSATEMYAGKNDFQVEVAFFDRNNNELGYGYTTNLSISTKGSEDTPAAFDAVCSRAKGVVENAVWSRDLTPWAVLDFCNYDLIRPAAFGGTGATK